MRSSLPFLLLAALSAVPASSAQAVNPQAGTACAPQPTDMDAVRSKAETGDALAEYELSRSMLSPSPTDSEFASAMPWFRRSAERGYAPAEYMYGGIFREGRWKDPKQFVYWWTKAAEQGNVNAQLWLGAFYEQGRYGIERDYLKAFKWLSMTAKQGQPDAQVALGQMYGNGTKVFHKTTEWRQIGIVKPLTTRLLAAALVWGHRLVQFIRMDIRPRRTTVFFYLCLRLHTRSRTECRKCSSRSDMRASSPMSQRRVRAWMERLCPTLLTQQRLAYAEHALHRGESLSVYENRR